MEGVESTDSCPECDGRIQQRGIEKFCEECGTVVGRDAIDHGPEWRALDGDTDRRRTGAPLERSRHDRGLSTEIGYGTGTEVTGVNQRRLVRMRQQHNRARFSSKAERNKAYGFTKIRRLNAALSLSTAIREQACTLFESAQSADLLCGRSIEGFAAASVYATCRVQSVSRTMDEILEVAQADRSELKAAYDAMNREIGLPIGPISPIEYIPRYASKLDLEAEIERRAREYAVALEEANRLGGKNPSGVAAACLYTAACDDGSDVTQIEAAELAGVSRMTIRSTTSDIEALCEGQRGG